MVDPRWRRALDLALPYLALGFVGTVVGIGVAIYLGASRLDLRWAAPAALAALGIIPLLAILCFHFGARRSVTTTFSHVGELRIASRTMMGRLSQLPRALRIVALALVALALARPQRWSADLSEVEGIDIVVALDVSKSMAERDITPNRLEAAKAVLGRLIARRRSDRIGLVIFGREAFTQCPLTLDYHALATLLGDVRLDLIDGGATAIGNALGTALNRLRKSDAKSKVIILLTDGDSNAGNLSPLTTARYAQSLGVKVFTILMGRDVAGPLGPFAVRPRYPINPRLLEEIAGLTGGMPYLATDGQALEQRFQAILDELDKSKIRDRKGRPHELYAAFAVPALGLLLLELGLSLTRFRRFP